MRSPSSRTAWFCNGKKGLLYGKGLYGGLFVHKKKVQGMLGANGVLLLTLLFYAGIIYGVVQRIKYFVRYGIDYYFQKLEAQQSERTQHKE